MLLLIIAIIIVFIATHRIASEAHQAALDCRWANPSNEQERRAGFIMGQALVNRFNPLALMRLIEMRREAVNMRKVLIARRSSS